MRLFPIFSREIRRCSLIACAGILVIAESALAGKLLDAIRDYDLNDYGLGVSISTGQNPYIGTKNSVFAYPFLTSFTDSTLNDGLLFFRDGDVGIRWTGQGDWEIGAVGRVQTLGLGISETDELLGVTDRKWALELGPTIGWRGWPVHVYAKSYAEVTNRHDGRVSELELALPLEWSRGYIVPAIRAIHIDSDYANFYYSVSAAEATPDRPAYAASAATNVAANVRWGYRLSDAWLLSGSVGFEKFDAAITDSPIVARDGVWSGRISLAYDGDVFHPRDYDGSAPGAPQVDVRFSAFQDSVSTTVVKDTSAGVPGSETDIEDYLGAADRKTVPQFDATLRFGHYHRLEFGYFNLGRKSSITLEDDLAFGDELFVAGTTVKSKVDARIYRAGYAYSLVRDAQKEVGIMGGLYIMSLDTEILSADTGQGERSRAGTPLPVIGAHATFFFGDKTSVGTKLQIFRTDFDRYEGSLNYALLDIRHRITDAFSIGLGYSYYGMKLTSDDSDVSGFLKVRHHGPAVFFTVGY